MPDCAARPRYRRGLLLFSLLLVSSSVLAEQFAQIGSYQAHYIVIPTTFLKADIAEKYRLPRGKNRALVNVSVLDANQIPVAASVSGVSRNLLGQPQQLTFNEVREGPAIYYLALLRHADEEHHRIQLQITLADGISGEIDFRQKMYFED